MPHASDEVSGATAVRYGHERAPKFVLVLRGVPSRRVPSMSHYAFSANSTMISASRVLQLPSEVARRGGSLTFFLATRAGMYGTVCDPLGCNSVCASHCSAGSAFAGGDKTAARGEGGAWNWSLRRVGGHGAHGGRVAAAFVGRDALQGCTVSSSTCTHSHWEHSKGRQAGSRTLFMSFNHMEGLDSSFHIKDNGRSLSICKRAARVHSVRAQSVTMAGARRVRDPRVCAREYGGGTQQ